MTINRRGLEPRHASIKDARVRRGTAGSRAVTITALAKRNSSMSPYCVPNEYICAELARILCLPIAPGGITASAEEDSQYWYSAMKFSEEDEQLPPITPALCVAHLPELCAGIILFDILIANGDRSESNLFLEETLESPEIRVFDHEYALLGTNPNQGEGWLTGSLQNQLGIAGHCLKPHITADDLLGSKWIQRIQSIPDYFIDEICTHAMRYGLKSVEANAASEFLKRRRHEIPHLVEKYASEFKSAAG